MTFVDFALKFPLKTIANALLFDAEEPRYTAVDVIGVIYDMRVNPPLPKEGWHVNIRVWPDEDTSALDAYKIPTPTNPKRVFA